MKDRKVVFLISGPSYLPYLVCSLITLRQHWGGTVEVHAWEESWELVKQIALDDRLRIKVHFRKPMEEGRRRKWQFLDKIRLIQMIDADSALYLDADTTVHGDVAPLFQAAEKHGFAATQFCGWTMAKGTIRKRVSRLFDIEGINQKLVQHTLDNRNLPSPNGGVFACRPGSPVLPMWEQATRLAMSIFIPDETVLHIMIPFFAGQGQLTTMDSLGRYNTSPKYQHKSLPDDEVVIYHFHGHSNVRINKSPKGFDLWMPLYRECMEKNVGGLADWRNRVENKYLDRCNERVDLSSEGVA